MILSGNFQRLAEHNYSPAATLISRYQQRLDPNALHNSAWPRISWSSIYARSKKRVELKIPCQLETQIAGSVNITIVCQIFLISSMGCDLSPSRSRPPSPATTRAQLEVQKVLKNMYLEIFEAEPKKKNFFSKATNRFCRHLEQHIHHCGPCPIRRFISVDYGILHRQH